jgi:hypothetical protein
MDRTRRTLIGSMGAVTLLHGAHSLAATDADAPYADPAAAEDWIGKAIPFGAANGALLLGRFADRMYFTTGPIGWSPDKGQEGPAAVEVPKGFVTDFASIPRVFWSVLPTDGNYAYSAILHDYLYWTQMGKREDADRVLQLSMGDFKVNALTIATIHRAVRLGGGFAWDGNRKLKKAGERRMLKRYPDDPTTRWADWKGKPGVFG